MTNHYCPKCHGEFQEWVKFYPDCGESLVDSLPPLVRKKSKTDFD
jgi:hypothetical protein